MKNEPVVTIPAALAALANAIVYLLEKMGVIPSDLHLAIVGVVNGAVLLLGLLIARSKVTPVHRADARVEAAITRTTKAFGEQRVQKKPAPRKPRPQGGTA